MRAPGSFAGDGLTRGMRTLLWSAPSPALGQGEVSRLGRPARDVGELHREKHDDFGGLSKTGLKTLGAFEKGEWFSGGFKGLL